MCDTEVTNNPEVKKKMSRIECEFWLEQCIKLKKVDRARDLIVKLSQMNMFDRKSALHVLQLAVDLKDAQCVSDLISLIPEFKPQEAQELLWRAIIISSAKVAEALVNTGAELNSRRPSDILGHTLLHTLVALRTDSEAFFDLALLMMDRGADVNIANHVGNTALHYAVAQYERPDRYAYVLAVELVRRGARVEATNRRGHSAIRLAMHHTGFDGQLAPMLIALADVEDDVKCRWIFDAVVIITQTRENESVLGLRSLLELGFSVLKMDDFIEDMWKIIIFVISLSKIEQLEVLIDYGMDINNKFEYSEGITTALHLALQKNLCDIAKLLIARGANIRAIDSASREPIFAACQRNSINNVRLLLRLGADVNIVDAFGRTPYTMIDSSFSSDLLRECLVESYAILLEKGIQIKEEVLIDFSDDTQMLEYFHECLDELQKMKTIKINHDKSLFRLLVEVVKIISGHFRNTNFSENLYHNKQNFRINFPIYFGELEYIVKMAETRRDIFLPKEEALMEALNLPQLVVEKIVEYACFDDLINFEKSYHISMSSM